MTHVRNSEELTELSGGREDDLCDICEQRRATGFWKTRTSIAVCYECAVDALPKLIVDSWFHEMTDTRQAEKMHETMRASFWKGVAARISRDSKVMNERLRVGRRD